MQPERPSPLLNTLREPRWSTANQRLAPPVWRPWLGLRGSLTAALRQLSNDRFHVKVLRQYWGRPQQGESQALHLDPRALCLIREVILFGNDQPWVFARSILPEQTLLGSLRRLRGLDDRPLGEILFANPRIQRGALQAARISPQHSRLPTLGAWVSTSADEPMDAGHSEASYNEASYNETRYSASGDAPLWGRRSVFALGRRRLLVAELFLPRFPCNERPPYNTR